jgi:hypothetical protein
LTNEAIVHITPYNEQKNEDRKMLSASDKTNKKESHLTPYLSKRWLSLYLNYDLLPKGIICLSLNPDKLSFY